MIANQAVLLISRRVTYLKGSVNSKILAKMKLKKKFTSQLCYVVPCTNTAYFQESSFYMCLPCCELKKKVVQNRT